MGIDLNSQKEKLLKQAQEARQKAMDAKQRVREFAGRGQKQRIIVIVVAGLLLLLFCGTFYKTAIQEESGPVFTCKPTPKQDCKAYLGILNLWRPYRMTPYAVPDDKDQ